MSWPLAGSPAGLLLTAALAFCVSASLLWFLLVTGYAEKLATDVPNQRSLHVRPVPRAGGWGIVPTVVLLAMVFAPSMMWVMLSALILSAVSYLDDRRGLSARLRLCAHVLVVAAFVVSHPVPIAWWEMVLVSVLLVWLTNLYNFMDGANGLAGGMAAIGFGGYAAAASFVATDLSVVSASISGSALGFLIFNMRPARMFLGDIGSISLGFLAGALGYWGWRTAIWPLWFPAMIFSPFIADASVTLLRRACRGEKFWHAHKEHYYQRMIRMGATHERVAFSWYLVMIGGIFIANVCLRLPLMLQALTAISWVCVLVILGARVDRRWRLFSKSNTVSWSDRAV